jgi:hypothetical protein
MSLFDLLSIVENNDSIHLGRLLILLAAFGGPDGQNSVDGLTKLAKLDFLLRYPANLERALTARGRKASDANVQDFERTSIESEMVRYRFGPWDFRYRRLINILAAKGLVSVWTEGRTVRIQISSAGRVAARELIGKSVYKDVWNRARLLKRHFDLTATKLMKFIYETFPEVISLRAGERIGQ